jgi:hypothetical protein
LPLGSAGATAGEAALRRGSGNWRRRVCSSTPAAGRCPEYVVSVEELRELYEAER